MKAYFIRRLLLIPLTLFGITLLVFAIVRATPGGPVERQLAALMGGEGRRSVNVEGGLSLTASQILEAEEDAGRDKGVFRSYFEWLGVLPRDLMKEGEEFPEGSTELTMALPGTVHEVTVRRDGDGEGSLSGPEGVDLSEWDVRILSSEEQGERWKRWVSDVEEGDLPEPRAVIFKPAFDGLLQGSLGQSEKYQDPVWRMILDRMPVSLFYGGISMVLVYGICLPLGIVKAIKHRSWLDNMTSVMVFAGYAIPGYALGALLVVFLGAQLGWFPLGGFTGDNFAELGPWEKVEDLFHHAAMPLICYVIGSFAFMTMIMKNNLMDHLASDYVRTAVAKGASFRKAVFGHALRNSLVPIATTFGANVTIFVTGSLLIERIFDINGFGLLTFNSLLEFDEPVIMGVLFVSALLMLVGNVISDLCVALVDPRVSYK